MIFWPPIEMLLNNACRAYNDMLYLCEKHGPLESLEKYNVEIDISVTGAHIPFVIKQLE